jgi:cell division septation protein DedD
MKNRTYIYFTSIIIGLLIIACSSEPKSEEIEIGNTVKVRSSFAITDSPDITFVWSYGKRPLTSMAKIIIDHNQVLFTPDIPGEYSIVCTVISPNNKLSHDVFHFLAVNTYSNRLDYRSIPQETELPKKEVSSLPVSQHQAEEKEDSTQTDDHGTINQEHRETNSSDKISDNIADKTNAEPVKNLEKSQIRKPVEVTIKSMPDFASAGKGIFSLQISSWKKESFAIADIKELKKVGIDAHIERTYMVDSDQIWFRVRVGNFKHYNDAVKAKQFVSSKINTDIWIDRVKKRN